MDFIQGGFGGLSFVVLDDILTPLNKRPAWMFGLGLSTGVLLYIWTMILNESL